MESGEEAGHIIRGLSQQIQLLASLHWLSSLQVLASIPQQHSVEIQEVADISGVPISQLLRSVRVAAAAGFLREPLPGYVEHTSLSLQLVRRPFLSDAVAFICEAAVPAALQMGSATRLQSRSPHSKQSAYNLASQTSASFETECNQRPRLKRQVAAYERLQSKHIEDGITEILAGLDWASLGDAVVVQVGARSCATTSVLATRFPNLRFVVQMIESDGQGHHSKQTDMATTQLQPHLASRISVQSRARGASQPIQDGAVYIVHLPDTLLRCFPEVVMADILAEVKIHFNLLRSNREANLVLVAQVLPESGETDRVVEANVRSQDLLMMQMTNNELLSIKKLREVVVSVCDETARLKIVNQLFSRQGPVVALQVKIEEFA